VSRHSLKNITAYILDNFYEEGRAELALQAMAVGVSFKIHEAYLVSHLHVMNAVDTKIKKIRESGGALSHAEEDAVRKVADNFPLHVGAGAEEANQPLFDFIEQKLFTAEKKGKKVTYKCNAREAGDFNFSPQPYANVEKKSGGFQSMSSSTSQENSIVRR